MVHKLPQGTQLSNPKTDTFGLDLVPKQVQMTILVFTEEASSLLKTFGYPLPGQLVNGAFRTNCVFCCVCDVRVRVVSTTLS